MRSFWVAILRSSLRPSARFFSSKSLICLSILRSRTWRAWIGIGCVDATKYLPFPQGTIGKAADHEGQGPTQSRRTGPPAQEFPHLAEESGGFRVRLLRRQLLEFVKQFALALGELLGRLYHHLDVHVAVLARAQHRHALAVQTEAPPRLRAFRHLHTSLARIDGGHLELAAERRLHHRDRPAAMQIGAVALEERVRGQREEDVEIAGRPA